MVKELDFDPAELKSRTADHQLDLLELVVTGSALRLHLFIADWGSAIMQTIESSVIDTILVFVCFFFLIKGKSPQ